MKRLFTLAIIAMIASLSFAQAPVQKAKLQDRKIEKVVSNAQMQKAMEVKAVKDAKAQAAQETSTSVLRHAAKRPTATMNQQMKAQKMVPNAQVSRVAKSVRTKSPVNASLKSIQKMAPAAKKAVAKGEAGDYVDVEVSGVSATYYATGDWYYELTAGAYKFIFDIYADPEPLNGTYAWETMDDYYSYAQYLNYYYDDFSDATFTIDADGNIDAYCTLLNSGEKYHITYTAPSAVEITSEETWSFAGAEAEFVDYTADVGVMQMIGDNGEQLAAITFNANQPTGTFTIDDVYGLGQFTIIYTSADDYDGVLCFDLNATVTETGAQIDYYGVNGTLYHINFTFGEGGSDEPTDITVTKDEHGIITSVEGGVTKSYARSADGTAYYASGSSMYMAAQSGAVTVVEDAANGKVYIKNPVTRYTQNSWVEGTINGNTIVVPAHQPLAWNTSYSATLSLRWGVIDAAGSIAAADGVAENFVFNVADNVWTLQGTAAYGNVDGDAYFMGVMWDDDDSFSGYGDAETVLTYDPDYVAPSTDLVVLPNGAEVEAWTMNAASVSSTGSTPVMNQPVNVAFVGNDVYLQGLFTNFPTAWVKGTKSGSTVTFNKLQYIGNYGGSYDIYFAGTDGNDLTNATATIDGETITFNNDILANAATDRIYYLTWLENVVISGVPAEEPVITDLTAELPYANGFDTEAEQAEAAIYDANGDGKTFTFAVDSNTSSTTARYAYHSSNAANDYVVFPGLALEAGKSYKVSVDARSYGSYYPERVEVVAGTVAKASELSTSVIPATDIAIGQYNTLTSEFIPEADGVYYFAIHAISDADMFYLYTDNFSVKENNPNAPKAATDFTAVAAEEGELSATLTYTLPETTVGGASLALVDYTIYRDGEVVVNSSAAAGTTKTHVDNGAHNGVNNYSLVVFANGVESEAVTTSVYVGEDTPADVENLKADDLNGKVGLGWTAPTAGANDGYINPANLKYNVYPVEMLDFLGMQFPSIDYENPYMTGITSTKATITYDTNSGAQAYTYFGVTAQNAGGESTGAMAALLTGAPYEMPFVESFDNDALSYWWGVDYDDNIYNADGGLGIADEAIVFVAPVEGWIELMSGKVALDGAENPALSFSYKSDAAASLQVKVITPAGEEIAGILPVEASDEFATATIDLSFYADQPWVRFNIVGEFETATNLYVDNFVLMDMVENDLSIAVSAPKSVVAGKTAVVKATVKNVGQNVAEDYEVKFYVNGDEAPAPMFETPAIAFMETADFEFELETSVFDEAGDVTIKAEVVFAADEKDADNADEVVLEIVAPSATPVASVTAENTAEGVVVNWTVESNSASEVTEDFESYEASTVYATGDACGPWTAADLSQGSTYSWNNGAWGHMGEAYSFGIIDVEAEGLDASFPASSGSKMAIFMSEVNEASQAGQESDKYMISPELPGTAQTISFDAMIITAQYGAEEFEVMVSTTDNNPASFTAVKHFSVGEEGMNTYSAQLPDGAKYFAIHYMSNDIFGLFVDDIKYTVGGGTATGYNVYVDQNLVAALGAEARSYTYAEEISDGDHEFAVTAVYGTSESAPVVATVEIANGITSINADSNVEIYTIDGIRMNSVKNLKSGVYVVNGQKVVIK